MNVRLRKFRFMLLSPVASLTLLALIAAENHRYLRPADFEPYHQRARVAIESLPHMIGSFIGVDDEQSIPKEAQKLLKPNKILYRHYSDASLEGLSNPRWADLLIVQCKQSGDMVGHYPPICYPSHGMELVNGAGESRDWNVGDENFVIPGMEYRFVKVEEGQSVVQTVYNFLVIPGRGIVRDMEGVKSAAADYQQRYYGAAQFQVVFYRPASSELSREQRDEIFKTLMGQAVPVIQQISQAK